MHYLILFISRSSLLLGRMSEMSSSFCLSDVCNASVF